VGHQRDTNVHSVQTPQLLTRGPIHSHTHTRLIRRTLPRPAKPAADIEEATAPGQHISFCEHTIKPYSSTSPNAKPCKESAHVRHRVIMLAGAQSSLVISMHGGGECTWTPGAHRKGTRMLNVPTCWLQMMINSAIRFVHTSLTGDFKKGSVQLLAPQNQVGTQTLVLAQVTANFTVVYVYVFTC
jgi:hypothetical protein